MSPDIIASILVLEVLEDGTVHMIFCLHLKSLNDETNFEFVE